MEKSQANFLESRVPSSPRNAPARGKVSGPAKPTRRGRPAPSGASVAHWAPLGPPPRVPPPFRSLAQHRGHFPGKPVPGCAVGGASEGRWDHSVPLPGRAARRRAGSPPLPAYLSAASATEWPRFQPGWQFPRRV